MRSVVASNSFEGYNPVHVYASCQPGLTKQFTKKTTIVKWSQVKKELCLKVDKPKNGQSVPPFINTNPVPILCKKVCWVLKRVSVRNIVIHVVNSIEVNQLNELNLKNCQKK
jgi:hypothetical protein